MRAPLVTIHVSEDGLRISRITEHGEEVVVPDLAIQMFAVRLWKQLCGGTLTGYDDVNAKLDQVGSVVSAARAALVQPLASLDALTDVLRDIRSHLNAMDAQLNQKIVKREDIKAWIADALSKQAAQGLFPGGQ